MTVEQILGYARVLLESFGLIEVMRAMFYIAVAAFVFRAFLNRRGD